MIYFKIISYFLVQNINLQFHILLNNTNSFSSESFLWLPSLLNLCYLKHLFINVSKLISTKYYAELFTVRWFPFFKLSLRGFELQLTRKPRSCKQIITLIMLLIECLSRFFSRSITSSRCLPPFTPFKTARSREIQFTPRAPLSSSPPFPDVYRLSVTCPAWDRKLLRKTVPCAAKVSTREIFN